jgi:ribonuclease G
MKKEILINVEADETRVAVLENKQLSEFMVERASEQSMVGNCYKGRVTSILPGMQAAFIEIGIEKAGFLHVDDVLYDMFAENPGGRGGGRDAERAPRAPQAGGPKVEVVPGERLSGEAVAAAAHPPTTEVPVNQEEAEAMEAYGEEGGLDDDAEYEDEDEFEEALSEELKAEKARRKEMRNRFRGKRPGIQDLLKKGQEIMVQVAKDPIGTKGPRLTTRISLAGRSLVLMPLSNTSGVSRKIPDGERGQLKAISRKLKPQGMGIIIRTLASGEGETELKFEVEALLKRWMKVKKAYDGCRAPALLYKEEGLTDRILREMLSKDVERIIVDHPAEHQAITEYVEGFGLGKTVRVEPWSSKVPLFDEHGLEKEIEKALREKVWLRSGGYLIIQQTEALTVIDVNTGKFVGKKSQDETIFRNNLEAAVEVARQLRLRDIGGIIVIDFIDMEIEDHKEKVYLALAEAIKKDKAKTNILQLTELGLIEMTRKRVKQSLVKELCQPCPYCEGRGIILSELSVALKVMRLLKRLALSGGEKSLIALVHPAVGAYLEADNARRLRQIEADYGIKVQVQDDYHMHREDIKILNGRSMVEIKLPE